MLSTWRFHPRKSSPVWRRVVVFLAGGIILTIGLAMVVLPGPAIIFVPLGLAILAIEFRWARKWLSTARQWLRSRFKDRNHESHRRANQDL
ncbi:MAG: PGPGW domain-containing protein [Alphaproteobacteria bacterium]